MGASCAFTALLVLSVMTLTRVQTQYVDILQGLQQLLQPYQGNDNYNIYNGPTRKQTNRQETKKKTVENRHQTEDRRTIKPQPMNHYDYVFATTEKLTRKTTKPNSSQNNNPGTFNNKNEYSNTLFGEYYNPYDITTKVNKVRTTTTTTEASYFNYDGNRGTTQNVFSNNFNVARPVTENVFENTNHRENFAVNNQARPADLFSNGANVDNSNNFNANTNSRPAAGVNNNNKETQNTDYNINFPSLPENNRNNNFGSTGVSFNDGGTTNDNRGNSNLNNNRPTNNFNQGNNFGGFNYPDTPLINRRPGVRPSPVDVGLPPITNRPASNNDNFGGFNRPSDSSTSFTDAPDQEPEILIGPDEDDMTERQKRRYAEKAERMCEYYKSLTVKKVVALPLVPSPDPVEIKVSDCVPINVPLVIGGSLASIREFPHMALVGWMKAREAESYSWKCGGSLISDRYVLTAGHCTYQDKDANVVSGPPQAVQLGSTYLDDRSALVVRISAVIRHPKYKQRRSYHDVALIEMVSKVKFSEVVRPACLGVPPPTGRSIIATGWGRTEFGGDHSVQLRSVSLNVWDMQECKDIWGTSLKLPNGVTPDSHMCAGDRGGGHDTCQGDSGGPAQIQDGCLWRVVAVTSYGRSCGAPDTPALYAVIPHAFIAAQVFEERS